MFKKTFIGAAVAAIAATGALAQDFPFTSISLNYNYAARLHRDGNNAGVSFTRSFGNFTGGELYLS